MDQTQMKNISQNKLVNMQREIEKMKSNKTCIIRALGGRKNGLDVYIKI